MNALMTFVPEFVNSNPWAISAVINTPLVIALFWLLKRMKHERRHRHFLTNSDALTGLPNRIHLDRTMRDVLGSIPKPEDLHSDGARGPALMLMDLDGFKEINDILGHTAGDAVLIQVAKQLKVAAGRDATVARIGGDEFAILLNSDLTASQAMLEAKKLLAALGAGAYTSDGPALEIRASIGIVQTPRDGRDLSALLDRADVALHCAKRTRCGAAMFTVEQAHGGLRDPRGTLSMLRGAMDENQLRLRYQPLVSADQTRVVGYEALVRWENPTRGLMLPGEFVPMAERTSLIHPLTRWVMLTALQQAATWRAEGMPPVAMSVNVSSAVLEEGLLGIVEEALALSQWPPELLVVELTETALSQSHETARIVVSALRERGVRVSVDDFGAGYTSLGQLCTLPVHELKVDRQFVEQLSGRAQEAITTSIIGLGHRLGLQVVAEGVETTMAATRLAEMGVDVLQGYLFARPMPPEDVPQWQQNFIGRISAPTVRPALPSHQLPTQQGPDYVVYPGSEGPTSRAG
jgi:diguanylate cyclase (GGDEF)-like protein